MATEVPHARDEAPDVETFAGEHQVVGLAGFSVRRGEGDAVVKAL
jgi:hypothetical protein